MWRLVGNQDPGSQALGGCRDAGEGEMELGLVSCWQLDTSSSLLSNDTVGQLLCPEGGG